MDTRRLDSANHYNASDKNVQELRVNAEELAASFPESTRFDTPPKSLLNNNQFQGNLFTNSSSETAFFPIDNTPTLEPITDSITGNEIREKDELRINQNIQCLANMKLRAEVPYFKQQELEIYIDELKAALHQKDEHLKQMGSSFRNHQRTFTNRVKDYEQRVAVLENKNHTKTTIIKVLCPMVLVLSFIPFLIKPKPAQNTITPSTPIANGYKEIQYTQPKKQSYYYTVQAKDTLAAISQKVYGDTKFAYTLQKNNNLSNKKLKPGTKLLISEIDEE